MQKEYRFYVYIMSNYEKTTFYIGFTNSIVRRVIEHMNGIGSYFTIKYKLRYLVYFEEYQYVNDAIYREKQLKGWLRNKKMELIESANQNYEDLSKKLFNDFQITDEKIKEYVKSFVPERNKKTLSF